MSSYKLHGWDARRPVKVGGVLAPTLVITATVCLVLNSLWGHGAALAGAIPVFILARRWVAGKRALQSIEDLITRAKADLSAAIGGDPAYIDLSVLKAANRGGIVVSGLAYDGTWLYVIEESLAERVPWSKVRRFEWKIDAAKSETVRVNVYAGTHFPVPDFTESLHNTMREVVALRNSGLFLHVADIERPVRQFITNDRSILQKWFEILTQMKEGRIAVS